MLRIGVDTGGTFTDLVLSAGDRLAVHKLRSTPGDPSRAILGGLRELLTSQELATDTRDWPADLEIVHGSTVATNAVLERKGARVALVATAGFEDVLRIGRQTRRELYNFLVRDRAPLVDPRWTFGVGERVDAAGAVLQPIDLDAVERLVPELAGAGIESVAICFLHAYANPIHEEAAAEVLARAGCRVSASSRILPEYREFERWSTTVLNAYVTPVMQRYLGRLEAELGATPLRIMQSNGGSISAGRARELPVQTILSGPAAGAVGAHAVASAAGYPKAIGFDMGGTSTDVTLIDGGIGMTTEATVGEFPVRLPMIDIHTVGAGGGSIAYLDAGGALRVGPRSAGADPGPACYGKGTELTVTDANLLLGRLDPDFFLGGRMALDAWRAREAATALGERLGLTALQVAEGVVRIANANMEGAIRVVSVRRGHDPREFALVAFGGAGGMHACDIADTLRIPTVIVPRYAGVLSALGMLLADVTKDYSHSVLRPVEEVPLATIDELFLPLERRAGEELAAEGFTGPRTRLSRSLDVRYVGQSYEITVPCTSGFRADFDRRHEQLYGYASERRPAEIVNVRVTAIGITDKPPLPRGLIDGVAAPVPRAERETWFDGRPFRTAVYELEALKAGAAGRGPAVLAGAQATAVIPPGYEFRLDEFGNVIATRLRLGVRS